MITISDNHYREMAEKLLETISNADFFNGTVCLDDAWLRATLLIWRAPRRDPTDFSGAATDIADIVPVWWEHHMQTAEGEELSDFDWHEFKKYLL